MPDLSSSLSDAARALEPTRQPEFASLRARAVRRARVRRTSLGLGLVVLLAGAGVALAATHDTPRTPVAAPCVDRTPDNAADVFVTVPASGRQVVDVFVHQHVTVGWATCTERGDLVPEARAKGYLDDYLPAKGVATARYLALGPGSTEITADGSEGSRGTLVLRATYPPEPDGPSSPSPFPHDAPEYAAPELCKAGDVTGADSYLTEAVTYAGQNLMEPPGSTRSKHTAREVLDAAARNGTRGDDLHAAFGLLTAPAYGGGSRVPRWIVYRCGFPFDTMLRGGPAQVLPTPAPETSPSPYGHQYGATVVLLDEGLHQLYDEGYGYADDAMLGQRFVDVPFARNHQDSADGRQIGITYATYDCATFSHLDGGDGDPEHDVYVRVWLRLTSDGPCHETGQADAVVGLRYPLGDRQVLRGEYRR